jgi:hypothetical protein
MYWSLLAWGTIVQTRLQRGRRFDIDQMNHGRGAWPHASHRTVSERSRLSGDYAPTAQSAACFDKYDALISPVSTAPAPELGRLGPEVPFATAFARVRDYFLFTPLQNVTGDPAISLPLGMSASGLPIAFSSLPVKGTRQHCSNWPMNSKATEHSVRRQRVAASAQRASRAPEHHKGFSRRSITSIAVFFASRPAPVAPLTSRASGPARL